MDSPLGVEPVVAYDPPTMAEEAAKQGVTIYTVGIGSSSGVPIPIKDKHGNISYKKDRQGNIVSTRMDELTLQTSGGFWHANGERLPW